MSRINWDAIGERYYETGVDHGVFYPMENGTYGAGVAWNGLTAVTENPSGAEASPHYADNIKYLNLMSSEEFGATVEAFTYPDEFGEALGEREVAPGVIVTQQTRKPFGFSYRTKMGNDIEGSDFGYKLHLVYNALAGVSDRAYNTINETPEAMGMSWEISTTPVEVPGMKPTAHMIIKSTAADPEALAALEDLLYGTDEKEATLPTPAEVVALLKGETEEV